MTKKSTGMVRNPRREKLASKQVAAGKRAATEGDAYNFSLRVSKLKMTKFMFAARCHGTNATEILNKCIDEYLDTHK